MINTGKYIRRICLLAAALIIAAVVLFVSAGEGFAARTASNLNEKSNPADISMAGYTWAQSNDCGIIGYPPGFPQGVNPGDNGDDPTQPQTAGVPLPALDRYPANIASASVFYGSDNITINLDNVYPGYYPTIFFGLQNQYNVPGVVSSITFTNPPELSMTLSGIKENDVIAANETVTGALSILVGPSIQTGTDITFNVSIAVTEQNTTPVNTPNINNEPEILPGGPPQPVTGTHLIQLAIPDAGSVSGITDSGIVIGTLAASTPDQSFSLSISQGTELALSNLNHPNAVDLSQVGSKIPQQIVVTNPPLTTVPPIPDGWVPVSKAYEVNGVTNGFVTGVQMSRPATLVIKYNSDELPPMVDGLSVFYYNYQTSTWVQLNPPEGFIAEGPEIAAQVNHFSLFIVLAKNGQSLPPADITIQTLTLTPNRIQVGQSSTVRVLVANKGGTAGTYTIVLRVSGQVQSTQFVQLGPGESKEVNITISPGLSGTYTVTAGDDSDNLIVESLPATATALNYWWIWLILGAAFLLFIIFGIIYLKPLLEEARRRTIRLEVPGSSTSSGISSQGVISGVLAVTTLDSRFSLHIEKRTKLRIPEKDLTTVLLSQFGNILPSMIEVTTPALDTVPSLPDGWSSISSPYDIHAITNGVVHGFDLDKPARLIIRYDIKEALYNKGELALFSFNSQAGWVKLATPENFIPQGAEIVAEIYRSSLIIVLVK